MAKNSKTDYVAWGLDEPTPAILDESLKKRNKIYKRVTRKLDRITLLLLVSSAIQAAVLYKIYTIL